METLRDSTENSREGIRMVSLREFLMGKGVRWGGRKFKVRLYICMNLK